MRYVALVLAPDPKYRTHHVLPYRTRRGAENFVKRNFMVAWAVVEVSESEIAKYIMTDGPQLHRSFFRPNRSVR
jgi:hypothetical protein